MATVATAGHLHGRQQGVQPVDRAALHGDADDRQGGVAGERAREVRCHPGCADEHAEAVGAGVFGEVRRSDRGAVRAEDVRLVGDAKGVELLTGRLDDRPIRVAAHNDCYFFHEILLKKMK